MCLLTGGVELAEIGSVEGVGRTSVHAHSEASAICASEFAGREKKVGKHAHFDDGTDRGL